MVDAPASPIATQETAATKLIDDALGTHDMRREWKDRLAAAIAEALSSAERRNEELVRERDDALLRAVEAETNDEVSREFLAVADRKVTKYAAEIASLTGQVGEMRETLEFIAEGRDVGRHDGLPEDGPAHDADTMFAVARRALAPSPPGISTTGGDS